MMKGIIIGILITIVVILLGINIFLSMLGGNSRQGGVIFILIVFLLALIYIANQSL